MADDSAPQTQAENASSDEYSIHRETDKFLKQIEALDTALPITAMMLHAVLLAEHKKFGEFLEANAELQSETDNVRNFAIRAGQVQATNRKKRAVERLELGCETLPRIYVVALVSQFDFFVGRLLRCLYYLRPELLNSSDRSLSFAQLVDLNSVDAAREYLIEKEVETLLRKSHSEQFDWLEGKFDIPLRKDLDSWSVFVELTQRRNLFVHANGVVSTQYLLVCEQNGVQFERTPQLGEVLGCTPEYFRTAYECILEVGVKLAQVLWRKVAPRELEKADASLMEISYELLVAESYELLIRLLEFGTRTLKKHSSEEIRRILTVNLALAHKWSGDDPTSLKILDALDWSACAMKFQLAVCVIRDECAAAADLVRSIGAHGEVPEAAYQEWPLFKEFRQSVEFQVAFQDAFGREFVLQEQVKGDEPAAVSPGEEAA